MLALYTAMTAALLVAGQSLWKIAAKILTTGTNENYVLLFIRTVFSVKFILGAILYVIATLAYLWLFSKFPYYAVQMTLISFSIIFSLLVAILFFKENLSLLNFLGVLLILSGAILISWKK